MLIHAVEHGVGLVVMSGDVDLTLGVGSHGQPALVGSRAIWGIGHLPDMYTVYIAVSGAVIGDGNYLWFCGFCLWFSLSFSLGLWLLSIGLL